MTSDLTFEAVWKPHVGVKKLCCRGKQKCQLNKKWSLNEFTIYSIEIWRQLFGQIVGPNGLCQSYMTKRENAGILLSARRQEGVKMSSSTSDTLQLLRTFSSTSFFCGEPKVVMCIFSSSKCGFAGKSRTKTPPYKSWANPLNIWTMTLNEGDS